MARKVRTVEQRLARIAGRGHGIVTREEALAADVTDDELRTRVHKGLLIRVHRGVYRLGHAAPSVEATYMAAVKAGGRGALLGGRAAAYLLGLIKGAAPPADVWCLTQRRVHGVRTRRVRGPARLGIRRRGIPLTSVPETLVDLGAELDLEALALACHEAGVKHGTTPAQVERALARRPNAPGARRLRLALHGDLTLALSRLEARFLELLREEGRQLPETNRVVDERRVDCRWPEIGLTVELDSYTYHRSRHAWERDRLREREAYARGDEFRRYTWGDVFEDSRRMLAEIRALVPPDAPSPDRRGGCRRGP